MKDQEIRKIRVTVVYKGFRSLCSFGDDKRQTARKAVEQIRSQADTFTEQAKRDTLCVMLRYEMPMWDYDAEPGDPPSEWLDDEKAYPSLKAAAEGLARDQNVFEEVKSAEKEGGEE